MEESLLATRARWLHAYTSGDVATLELIEAVQFSVTNKLGTQSKHEQLSGIAAAVDANNWFPSGTRTEDKEREVHIQGNTALIRGYGRTVTPRRTLPTIAFTEVWQQVGNAWQTLHLHYTEVQGHHE